MDNLEESKDELDITILKIHLNAAENELYRVSEEFNELNKRHKKLIADYTVITQENINIVERLVKIIKEQKETIFKLENEMRISETMLSFRSLN